MGERLIPADCKSAVLRGTASSNLAQSTTSTLRWLMEIGTPTCLRSRAFKSSNLFWSTTYDVSHGPRHTGHVAIVYRLGHLAFYQRSGVRFPVATPQPTENAMKSRKRSRTRKPAGV